jgi:hypothetical protein
LDVLVADNEAVPERLDIPSACFTLVAPTVALAFSELLARESLTAEDVTVATADKLDAPRFSTTAVVDTVAIPVMDEVDGWSTNATDERLASASSDALPDTNTGIPVGLPLPKAHLPHQDIYPYGFPAIRLR